MAMGNLSYSNLPFSATFKILHEALKIPTKTWRLFLPILLSILLFSSLLFLANYFIITPILLRLFINLHVMHITNPGSPEECLLLSAAKDDTKTLVIIEFIFTAVSVVVSSFLQMAVVHSTITAYFSKHLSIEELVARLRKSWKAPLVTQLYVAVLNLCCVFMLMVLIGFFAMLDSNSLIMLAFGVIFVLLAVYMYANLVTVWSTSTVVSVIEEGCYGVEAMERAMELISGRQKKGLMITFLLMVSSSGYYGAYALLTAHLLPPLMTNPMANALIVLNASLMMNMFVLILFTLFYYDCKRGDGEEEMDCNERRFFL